MSQEVLAMRPKQIYGEEELFGGFSGTLQHFSVPLYPNREEFT